MLSNRKSLSNMKCEACSIDSISLTEQEQQQLLGQLVGWELKHEECIPQLDKSYKFKNYKQAWAFANRISELAETEGHHPAILLEWGKVTVTWWSHSIRGLHNNDFVCAAKCDELDLG
ncbi:4a-hydroxytetrahydrobiopterin dehydratase [Vibrio genomosp. F10 str. ZF-129]|uniref:Putative pterin-4-alpha-carbinolamine dehydratase n=1 Tax=Vibrio genomosp. F10 str. ZF-129 TaxID=1187848 RepID=A0A1E5BCW3_9VIBR|nr:4a-hydroxytetrahydrobiopterin dehydratase [Vibrio genomosp. F10]OEE32713.1 4a-hydroxytetrahydrobiopterin dehydratase [Vibrio genomosp. F10 str. ZF-129]